MLFLGKFFMSYRMEGINVNTGTYQSTVPMEGVSYTSDGSKTHPDGRNFLMDANGDLLACDDGGIWKRTDSTSSNGKWVNMGGNIRAVECFQGRYDSTTGIAMCGNQDNGVIMGLAGQPWYVLRSGDGFSVALSTSKQNNPRRFYDFFNWRNATFPFKTNAERAGVSLGVHPNLQYMASADEEYGRCDSTSVFFFRSL